MEYLYKYTSLSSLIYILKDRELRLNPLPTMDDQEERLIADMSDYAKYCFVSSWTDCPDEKLSLWNMYTDNMTGIRLKLRKNPFEIYYYKIDDDAKNIHIDGSTGTYIPKEWFENPDSYAFIPITLDNFLIKVEYTEDENLLNPHIATYHENNTNININIIGKYKRKEWYFQDEVRYRIIYLPFRFSDVSNDEMILAFNRMDDLPFTGTFFKIREECFNEIEITTGPKMSAGDKEILNLIVEKYCPHATIVPSKFTGKIL